MATEQVSKNLEFPAKGEQENAGLGSATGTDPSSASTFRYSPTFGKLCEALCKASLEFEEVSKDTENKYYGNRYADLAALIAATRPALAKHGLFVTQSPEATTGGVLLTTMLMHTSGEWLANYLELSSAKSDAQGKGSAITYARRYSYQSILNIAAEEDDDGNAAVGKTQQDRRSSSIEGGEGRINPVQIRAIQSACKTGGKTPEQLTDFLGRMGYESIEEVEKKDQDQIIKWAVAR